MKKILLLLLVFLAPRGLYAAAEEKGDEAEFTLRIIRGEPSDGVSHLPRKLKAPAVEFFDAIEEACRFSSFATHPRTPYMPKSKGRGLREYYPESTIWRSAAARYINFALCEDGIGQAKNPVGLEEKDNLEQLNWRDEYGVGIRKELPVPKEIKSVIDQLTSDGFNNPYALYFKGIFEYHSSGASSEALNPLIKSGNHFYGRAFSFLSALKNGLARRRVTQALLTREWAALVKAQARLEDPESGVGNICLYRTGESREIDNTLLKELEDNLLLIPGEANYWGIYQSMSTGIQNILTELNQSYSAKDFMVIGSLAGLVGGIPWLIWDTHFEPAVVVVGSGAAVASSWERGYFFRAIDRMQAGFRRLGCSRCKRVKRTLLPMMYSQDEIVRESSLAGLYITSMLAKAFNHATKPLAVDVVLAQVKTALKSSIHSNDTIIPKIKEVIENITSEYS